MSKNTRETLKGSTKTQGDFNLAHRFNVELDGLLVGGCHTVEGLEHEHEVVEYQDMKIVRDFGATKEFFNWRKTVLDGKVERKSVSIILLNDAGEEAMRYNLFECWPIKYKGPDLNSRNSAHATEAIELAYETFEMK